jgi:hypothetical protein
MPHAQSAVLLAIMVQVMWQRRKTLLTAMMPNMTANKPLTIACGIEANRPPNLPAVRVRRVVSMPGKHIEAHHKITDTRHKTVSVLTDDSYEHDEDTGDLDDSPRADASDLCVVSASHVMLQDRATDTAMN